jgi:hypothetical protein
MSEKDLLPCSRTQNMQQCCGHNPFIHSVVVPNIHKRRCLCLPYIFSTATEYNDLSVSTQHVRDFKHSMAIVFFSSCLSVSLCLYTVLYNIVLNEVVFIFSYWHSHAICNEWLPPPPQKKRVKPYQVSNIVCTPPKTL